MLAKPLIGAGLALLHGMGCAPTPAGPRNTTPTTTARRSPPATPNRARPASPRRAHRSPPPRNRKTALPARVGTLYKYHPGWGKCVRLTIRYQAEIHGEHAPAIRAPIRARLQRHAAAIRRHLRANTHRLTKRGGGTFAWLITIAPDGRATVKSGIGAEALKEVLRNRHLLFRVMRPAGARTIKVYAGMQWRHEVKRCKQWPAGWPDPGYHLSRPAARQGASAPRPPARVTREHYFPERTYRVRYRNDAYAKCVTLALKVRPMIKGPHHPSIRAPIHKELTRITTGMYAWFRKQMTWRTKFDDGMLLGWMTLTPDGKLTLVSPIGHEKYRKALTAQMHPFRVRRPAGARKITVGLGFEYTFKSWFCNPQPKDWHRDGYKP